MKRKKNRFVKPRKAYESARIAEENELKKKYALKNKREIWKTIAKMTYFRHRAMNLSKAPREEQEVFLGKLRGLGLKAETLSDILNLKIENLLERRLPTIVFKNGLSSSVRHARQMVVHKKVLVDGSAVNIPSFIVPVSSESKITIRTKKHAPKEKKEEALEEVAEVAKEEEKVEEKVK